MGIFSRRSGDSPKRTPPPELLAEAAAMPGGWVYEIDQDLIDDPDGYVPPEAIRGAWKIGEDGRPTGEYEPNDRHGPVRDDFAKLTEPDHWLGWLGEDPAATLRQSIARELSDQVTGAVLNWIKVLETPRFLTAGRPGPDDPERLVVTRAGLAVPFALSVQTPSRRREFLLGTYTWVAVGLDQPDLRRDQVWFDVRADLDWAEQQLRTRIYQLDDPR